MIYIKKIMIILLMCGSFIYNVNANAKLYIIVNKNNPMTSISKSTLKRLYLGKVVSVPGVKHALSPIELSARSPARAEFLRKVIRMKASLLMQYRSRQIFSGKGRIPLTVGGQGAAESIVARRANSIAYVSKAPRSSKVKTVLIL